MQYKSFLKEFKTKHKLAIIKILFISFVFNIFMLAIPYFDKIMIDFLTQNKANSNTDNFVIIFLLGLLMIGLIYILNYFHSYINQSEILKILCTYKSDVMNDIFNMEQNNYDKKDIGYFLTLYQKLPDIISGYIGILSKYFQETIILGGSLLILFLLNYKLTLISLVILPLSMLSILLFQKKINFRNKIFNKSQIALNDIEQNMMVGKKIAKRYQANSFLINNIYKPHIDEYQNKNLYLNRMCILAFNSLSIMDYIIHLFIILGGGYLILKDKSMTIGSLIAFSSYVVFMTKPIMSLSQIGLNKEMLKTNLELLFNIYQNHDEEKPLTTNKPNDSVNVKYKTENIFFNNVFFRYADGNQVLNNLSFELKSNKLNIIYGESGSGKSTIAKLLCGLYNFEGNIFIGNTDIRNISEFQLTQKIVCSDAVPFLFNIKVIDNIILGRDVDLQLLQSLATQLQLDSEILNTTIEKNSNLSDGQKKRIELLRVLLSTNADVFIFDEPTANLDDNNSKTVYSILKEISQNYTVIVLTHDNHFKTISENVIYL